MPQVQKLLGRANPAAATPGTIYTSPAVTKTLVTSLLVCNFSTADDSITVWLVPSGGATGNSNVIIQNLVIDFGDPYMMNSIPTMEAGDFLVVQSVNGNCCFTASGLQIT